MHSATLDIEGAFRIPALEEEIYLELPPGMKPGKALLLNKSMYGLKQAACNWHTELCTLLDNHKFTRSKIDGCLYFKRIDDKLVLIGIYVDDIRLLADNEKDLKKTDELISSEFPVQYKDQSKYLGIQITNYKGCITLDQTEAIDELLLEYNLADAHPARTPAAPGTKLVKPSNNSDITTFPYNELLGSLLWIASVTRPDIYYAVGQCLKFATEYDNTHIVALKRILRYLKGSKDMCLKFNKGESIINIITYMMLILLGNQ